MEQIEHSYHFSRISKNNLHDLISIYNSAFQLRIPSKFLFQKFDTERFNIAYIGYIAYTKQGQPAAFYGVFPCNLSYHNKSFLVAQSGDTMTHRDHQGKGLFTTLAQKTYALAKEEGIELIFGFPNENSFPGFIRKLDWVHFDDVKAFEIRVKCLPWVRIKKTFKIPQAVHNAWCKFVFTLLPKGKPFESSCKTKNNAVVDHSNDFFLYKTYAENYLKKFGSTNVWFKHDEMFLIIGDLEKCSEDDFLKTIKRLKRLAFICGLPHLRFHASSDTWGEQLFSKYGKEMEAKYPVGGISFNSSIPLEKLKFTAADNDTF